MTDIMHAISIGASTALVALGAVAVIAVSYFILGGIWQAAEEWKVRKRK
jgi:hypothetical protein